eukprot:1161350-Pelagomonas_calceolata.AAC.10
MLGGCRARVLMYRILHTCHASHSRATCLRVCTKADRGAQCPDSEAPFTPDELPAQAGTAAQPSGFVSLEKTSGWSGSSKKSPESPSADTAVPAWYLKETSAIWQLEGVLGRARNTEPS